MLVTVSSNLLQIFVRASPHDLATQIDIPLLNIASHDIDLVNSIPTENTVHTMQLRLLESADAPLFINANDKSELNVGISYDSHHEASNLHRLIRTKMSKAAEKVATMKNGKKTQKKIVSDSGDSNLRQELQVGLVAPQKPGSHNNIADAQYNHLNLHSRAVRGVNYIDAKAVAAEATSLLASSEQTSVAAQHLVPMPNQGPSQSRGWSGLKGFESNDRPKQDDTESLKDKADADVPMTDTKTFEVTRTLPQGKRLSISKTVEEDPDSLGVIPKIKNSRVYKARRRTSNAYADSNQTKSQGSKKRKIVQDLQDDRGEVDNSGQRDDNLDTRETSSALAASKSDSSKTITRPNTILAPKKHQVIARDARNKQFVNTQMKEPLGSDQDLYDFPTSPALPETKRTLANRANAPAGGRSSKAKTKSTGAVLTKTQNKSSKHQNTQPQASTSLARPKSQRTAAIHANTENQSNGKSVLPSLLNDKQEDRAKQRAVHNQRERVMAKANAVSQRDLIETDQTAKVMVPSTQEFVPDSVEEINTGVNPMSAAPNDSAQDSIETLGNVDNLLSAKRASKRSNEFGNRETAGTTFPKYGRDTKTVERGPEKYKQAIDDPIVPNDSTKLALGVVEEATDLDLQQILEKIPQIGTRIPNERETEQFEIPASEIQAGKADTASRQGNNEASAPKEVPEKNPFAQEIGTIEHMRNEKVLEKDVSIDHSPALAISHTAPERATEKLMEHIERASNQPQHGQPGNVDTPKCMETPEVHDSPVKQDPFLAKLKNVVREVEITKVDHWKHNDALKGNSQSGTLHGNPMNSSTLKEDHRDSSAHSIDAQAKKSVKALKRKADEEVGNPPKKPRINFHEIDESVGSLTKKTPPIGSRKTAIISFSASGPRNQGVASKHKDKRLGTQASDAKEGRLSEAVNKKTVVSELKPVNIVPSIELQQPVLRRASNPPYDDDHVAFEDGEPMALANIERELHTHPPNRFSQLGNVEGLDSKPSSQTTRVNHNGSPMPVRHPTNEPALVSTSNPNLKDEEYHMPRHEQQLEIVEVESSSTDSEDHSRYDGEEKEVGGAQETIHESTLPPKNEVSHASISQIGAYNWTNIARNSKQIPSSPHEPSATAVLPAHHMYNGQIINPGTNEAVVPANPHDPFTAASVMPSSFIRLLQKASENHTQQRSEAALDKQAINLKISSVSALDDPEKTMVESTRSRRHMNVDDPKHIISSRSSRDTSEEATTRTLIEEIVEDTPTQWKKALLPHQKNTLEVLTEISHRLLAHMIKDEDAFIDLIHDFKNSGNKLIDHLEEELQEGTLARTAATFVLEKKVFDLFQKTMVDLKETEGKTVGRTSQMETEVNAHQKSLLASADAALALCQD